VSAEAGRVGERDMALRSRSVEETEHLGETLAPHLEVGDVVLLTGPLGAGKTRFVAGLARGLSIAARVRSPSFAIVNEYRGRLLLLHLDLFRLEAGESVALGLEEQIERGALVVEWGERLGAAFADEALAIEIEPLAESERRLRVSAQRGRGLALLEAWRRSER